MTGPNAQMIRAEADLIARHPWLASVPLAVLEIVMILDADRRIVFANDALGCRSGSDETPAFLGRRPGDAIGCLHAAESAGGCQTSPDCEACRLLGAVVESAKAARPEIRETVMIGADGHDRHYRIRATPVTVEGQPFTILALLDRSAEVRLRSLEKYVFHDTLNLAAAVRGAAELLAEAPPDQQNSLRDMIHATSMALIQDIQDQRDLAALEHRERHVIREAADSRAILEELLKRWQGEAARGRRLRLAPESCGTPIETDRDLLMRALHSLLRSAVEPTRPGDTITLSCDADKDRVRFVIRHPAVLTPAAKGVLFQHPHSIESSLRVWSVYVPRIAPCMCSASRRTESRMKCPSAPQPAWTGAWPSPWIWRSWPVTSPRSPPSDRRPRREKPRARDGPPGAPSGPAQDHRHEVQPHGG
jgi:hypothetical protein